MKKALPFVVAGVFLSWLILVIGLPTELWNWWQDNLVETAYTGPDWIVPTRWWAFPATVVSFFIPLVPFYVVAGLLMILYHFAPPAGPENHKP